MWSIKCADAKDLWRGSRKGAPAAAGAPCGVARVRWAARLVDFVYLVVDGGVEEWVVAFALGVEAHGVLVYEAEFLLHLHVVDEAGGFVVFEYHFGDAFVVAFLHGEGDDVVVGVGGELEVGVEVVVDAVDVAVHGPGEGVAEQFHEGYEAVVEVEVVAVDAVVEVGGGDDVVFALGLGVAHGYFGFGVAVFGGGDLLVVEGAVAVLGGFFLDFYEVVAEGVLYAAVLFVGGDQFVEDDAVFGSDGLGGEGDAECQQECEECDCFFHGLGLFVLV